MIQTIVFLAHINMLLQVHFGTRVLVMMGGSNTYIYPTIAHAQTMIRPLRRPFRGPYTHLSLGTDMCIIRGTFLDIQRRDVNISRYGDEDGVWRKKCTKEHTKI
jgi:hypothetical protein